MKKTTASQKSMPPRTGATSDPHPAPPKLDAPQPDLIARWQALKANEPNLRARDAAARLGVSEAELLAARTDVEVSRLDGPWEQLVGGLARLGPVMALTRNDHAVHEKVCRFDNVTVCGGIGRALGDDLDLLVFFEHWHHGFAVTESLPNRARRSLQFFDAAGTAVHKIYLRGNGNEDTFRALARKHRHARSTPSQAASGEATRLRPSGRNSGPSHMSDRRFSPEQYGDDRGLLPEPAGDRVEFFRSAPGYAARRVPDDSFQVSLRHAAETGLPVTLVVGNPGAVQVHAGPVRRLKQVGPWFNVLDPGFSLHLRADGIAAAWVLQAPTRDGVAISLEIFAADGREIARLSGSSTGDAKTGDWQALAASLRDSRDH